jgi:glycine/D-amino acid oxidase-like deaminating enzyme
MVAHQDIFTPGVKLTPWWWEWAPRQEQTAPSMPRDVEIGIVGSGFTALSAALTLARAGKDVALFETGAPGFGASSRNGGQVGSGNQRFSVKHLVDAFGDKQARALLREGVSALEYVGHLIESEGIDCHFKRVGRYRGANRPQHYEIMLADHEELARYAGIEFHAVPKSEQHLEIGTDYYHGGTVLPNDASLHPALYHEGLMEKVLAEGVRIIPFTPVLGLSRERQRMVLTTSRGEVSAGDVILATNGYTGTATPSYQARVVPVPSAIIATEPIDPVLMQKLMPRNRVIGETRRVFYYYRACPEHRRILFGGRNARVGGEAKLADFVHLYEGMLRIFPELKSTRVTHCWTGYTGYTRDTFPHAGGADGLYFAMGYCGSGVARATYLGHKLACRFTGESGGSTAWDEQVFKKFTFPAATRALLPAAIGWHRLRDTLDL